MSNTPKQRTTQVQPQQIVEERPETTDQPRRHRPPVRERAPTSLYPRVAPPRSTEAPERPAVAPAPEPVPRAKPAAAAHRQLVSLCPLPLVQLDTLGNVLWANDPFCEFVREDRDALLGRRVDETRLGVLYPTVLSELQTCAGQVAPPTIKQVLRFEERDGRSVTWLCWLAPETNAFGEVLRLFGYLHPLSEQL